MDRRTAIAVLAVLAAWVLGAAAIIWINGRQCDDAVIYEAWATLDYADE